MNTIEFLRDQIIEIRNFTNRLIREWVQFVPTPMDWKNTHNSILINYEQH